MYHQSDTSLPPSAPYFHYDQPEKGSHGVSGIISPPVSRSFLLYNTGEDMGMTKASNDTYQWSQSTSLEFDTTSSPHDMTSPTPTATHGDTSTGINAAVVPSGMTNPRPISGMGTQYTATNMESPSSFGAYTCQLPSFGASHALIPRPKLTKTMWEDQNTDCYQVDAKGICVARRMDNDMVNGTKLLNVTGMSRGKRDGILKNEKGRIVIKVGAMHLKGVWITFERAQALSSQYKIDSLLYPLFERNPQDFLYSSPLQPNNGRYSSSLSGQFRHPPAGPLTPVSSGWDRSNISSTSSPTPSSTSFPDQYGFSRPLGYSHLHQTHPAPAPPVSSGYAGFQSLPSLVDCRSSMGGLPPVTGVVGNFNHSNNAWDYKSHVYTSHPEEQVLDQTWWTDKKPRDETMVIKHAHYYDALAETNKGLDKPTEALISSSTEDPRHHLSMAKASIRQSRHHPYMTTPDRRQKKAGEMDNGSPDLNQTSSW